MTTKTKVEKIGNAECVHCGLRASSKNVAIRNVFIIWPDDANDYALSMLESAVQVEIIDERVFFTIRDYVHREDRAKGKSDAWVFAQWIREVVRQDPKLEHLEQLLCVHRWRQDPGTATV